MSAITEILTGLGSGLAVAIIVAGARCLARRARSVQQPSQQPASLNAARMLRRYTLLRTANVDGTSKQYVTTRPPGKVITCRVEGHPRRFELTDAPLGDGTYAAEPLDHL